MQEYFLNKNDFAEFCFFCAVSQFSGENELRWPFVLHGSSKKKLLIQFPVGKIFAIFTASQPRNSNQPQLKRSI
jgi:hypothetical protein